MVTRIRPGWSDLVTETTIEGGEINATVSGQSATNTIVTGDVTDVADNVLTTILTKVAGSDLINISIISVSGEDYAKYYLYINGTLIDIRRTGPDRNLQFDYTSNTLSLAYGDIVDVKVQHFNVGATLDFEATLYGYGDPARREILPSTEIATLTLNDPAITISDTGAALSLSSTLYAPTIPAFIDKTVFPNTLALSATVNQPVPVSQEDHDDEWAENWWNINSDGYFVSEMGVRVLDGQTDDLLVGTDANLMLQGDNNFTDSSSYSQAITAGSLVTFSTTRKFGTHSMDFPGGKPVDVANQNYISVNTLVSDTYYSWDMEFWMYMRTTNLDTMLLGQGAKFLRYRGNIATPTITFYNWTAQPYTFAQNTWYHFYFTGGGRISQSKYRNSYMFINGANVGGRMPGITWTNNMSIGASSSYTGFAGLDGLIDEFRLRKWCPATNGNAMIGESIRRRAPFTPPTAAYGTNPNAFKVVIT